MNLSEEEFETNKELIENEIDRKRAKHAVYENQRTLKAVKALEDNNYRIIWTINGWFSRFFKR